jgi:hypothetical protein
VAISYRCPNGSGDEWEGEYPGMADSLSLTDSRQLIRLCEAGRLYEVEQWIRAGRSLMVCGQVRKTPLGIALDTGFHSLIDLLLRHEESQQVKDDVLRDALSMHKPAFIELAIANGAEVESVAFLDVLLMGDREVVLSFLERDADPIANHPFARAFHQLRAKTTLGSYLDCRRVRPDLAEALQRQVDMALRQFAQEGNLKWVSLLMWAGADPRSLGPTIEDIDHPEFATTGLHEACASGSVEVLKRLQPTRDDDLAGMLERAAFYAHSEIIEYLLDLSANPNDKPDGGSSAFDACLRTLGWEELERVEHGDCAIYEPLPHRVSKARSAIGVLLQHGAVWTPDMSTLNKTRRILYKLEPKMFVDLVDRLRSRESGQVTVRELLRVAQMRRHLAFCQRRLAAHAVEPRRTQRSNSNTSSMPSRLILTRDDRWSLFDAVWSKPTAKVARRYGIPAAELVKVCKELEIPMPPRGYWVKKRADQPVPRRPRLPPQKRPS